MKNLLSPLTLIKEYLNGDFAYKKYLENFAKHQHSTPPLNKEDFLRQKRLAKKNDVRCC